MGLCWDSPEVEQIVRREARKVTRYALRSHRDDVEQELRVALWLYDQRHPGDLDERMAKTICRRRAIDWIRSETGARPGRGQQPRQRPLSLDAPLSPDTHHGRVINLLDTVVDGSFADTVTQMRHDRAVRDTALDVRIALRQTTFGGPNGARDRQIIGAICDGTPKQDVAARHSITPARVSQIWGEAVRKALK